MFTIKSRGSCYFVSSKLIEGSTQWVVQRKKQRMYILAIQTCGTIGLADSNLGMLGGLNYRLPRIQENIKMASTTFC
jgi:hypothetical protein